MKIILTESQFRVLQEAVGVPEGILQAGEELYNIVSDELKQINSTEDSYDFEIDDVELKISDITFDKINLTINVQEVEDLPFDTPKIASMGVANEFNFDEGVMLQVNVKSSSLDLNINFIAPEGWEAGDLYKEYTGDKEHNVSVMSHEVMHRFHRQKQTHELMGGTADYSVYASGTLRFGIPVISDFMRYSYYIQYSENIVRPTEIASRMMQKGIKREEFYDFMMNDEVFKELKSIKDFSYNYFISQLYEQMEDVNGLIKHASGYSNLIEEAKNFLENECGYDLHDINLMSEEDIVNALHDEGNDELAKKIESLLHMDDDEKIKSVLELVYINLVNAKVDSFDNFFYSHTEKMAQMFSGLMGNLFGGQIKPPSEEKEKVRRKFINHVAKYQNREMDFFKDECERFNYVATNLIKKISKIYALLPDEKEQTNESILDWELHQKIMEKRYGKRPIQTSYNFRK